jgi:hypothetical protein
MALGAAVICGLLALANGACSSSAAFGGEEVAGVLAKHKQLHILCERRHGKTILRRGVVRVFKTSSGAYGCVEGSLRIVSLWGMGPEDWGVSGFPVKQVAGRFIAVQFSAESQYEYAAWVTVVDLRSGSSYTVASLSQPTDEEASGEPPTPGPWPLEAFALGSDGRTARLYDTFSTHPNPSYEAARTGQVLDLVGFHHFRRQLAVSGPGVIAAMSLSYNNQTVTWTQNGAPQSASS